MEGRSTTQQYGTGDMSHAGHPLLTAIAALSPYLLAIAAAMLSCSASSCSSLASSGHNGRAGFLSAAIPLNRHSSQFSKMLYAVQACTGRKAWNGPSWHCGPTRSTLATSPWSLQSVEINKTFIATATMSVSVALRKRHFEIAGVQALSPANAALFVRQASANA